MTNLSNVPLKDVDMEKVLDNLMSHFHNSGTAKVMKTIRLSETMSNLVEEQAHDSGLTFSHWVRRAIASELRRSNGQ